MAPGRYLAKVSLRTDNLLPIVVAANQCRPIVIREALKPLQWIGYVMRVLRKIYRARPQVSYNEVVPEDRVGQMNGGQIAIVGQLRARK